MRQLLLAAAFSFFLPMAILGQDEEEYDYIEKTMQIWPENDNKYNVTTGAPIVTTCPFSKSETIYRIGDVKILEGDKIAKIGYMGYNPGGEVERHVIVWMQRVDMGDMRVGSEYTPVDNMTKVFEGDIVIKSGGDPDHWIQLIDITLDVPFTYHYDNLRITVVSSGEVSDHDVYFGSSNAKWTALYSTADQMESVSDSPQYDNSPQLRYTVASKVEYLTGKVCDQDGNPVSGAEVTLTTCLWEQHEYKGVSDTDGNYQVRASEGRNAFRPSVKAPGCVPYAEECRKYVFENPDWLSGETGFDNKKMDFTLYNALDFKAGKMGSIILPVVPDATLGKYYRLDRRDGNVLYFEHEPNPQANVPYLLMPNADCRVDISEMNLSLTPGVIELDEVSFIGSYVSTNHIITTNQSIFCFDETPDCDDYRIGGCRAYILTELWRVSVVLVEPDGIEQLTLAPNGKDTGFFDLQGRRLHSKPSKGVYIQNGRKIVQK